MASAQSLSRPHVLRSPRTALAALLALSMALMGTIAGPFAPAARAAGEVYSLVGDLQSELGCTRDWDPTCTAGDLAPVAGSSTQFASTIELPAGSYEFKVVVDRSFSVAYGRGGDSAGGSPNIRLTLGGTTELDVSFDLATGRVGLAPAQTDATAAPVAEPVRQPGSGEQFYFVMADRFADGDPTNNDGGTGSADRMVSGYDPTDKGWYQGGDLAGLLQGLDYIQGLGTTAIWLTPSFKNKFVQTDLVTGESSAGYHGYWVTDFEALDPHYGTEAELDAFIAAAHSRGMKVYFDIITNHTADVIGYEEAPAATRPYYPYRDIASYPYRDANGAVVDVQDLAGTRIPTITDFPYTPVVDPAEADVKNPAWLNDVSLYHNRGWSTYAGESSTFGDFDNLDDLLTEDERVVDGMAAIFTKWIDRGVDGFRIDTVKHVNMEFWEDWTAQITAHTDAVNPDFFMFGEVYEGDARNTAPYVRNTDMSSVLDFPFAFTAQSWAQGGSGVPLRGLFESDDLYLTPDSSPYALPTFLGNHDMGRIGYFVRNASARQERSVLAHELMFLTRGQPVVYYGDEQGFVGSGGDKDARQTMFGSQVAEYQTQTKLDGTVMGTGDHFNTSAALYTEVAALSDLRAAHPALVDGAQVEQFVSSGSSVYAFSRVHGEEKVEYLVALNNGTGPASATFTALSGGAAFTSVHGGGDPLTAAADGTVTVTVPALSAVVYRAGTPLPANDGIPATFRGTAGQPVAGLQEVAVDLGEEAYAETTFSYRVAGGDWQLLGTSDTGKPRVFHTTDGLAAGTLIEYAAVVVDASGTQTRVTTYATVGEDYGPGAPEVTTLVTVPGSHNAEMGCAADWQPDCQAAALTLAENGLYSGTFDLPAGTYDYKVAVGGSWAENYGADGVFDGRDVRYTVPAVGGAVTFWFDPVTKKFTNDAADGHVYTLAGSFQSELGCAADWSPACLAAPLADLDDDGVYTYTTTAIPAGDHEVKAARDLDWATSYGTAGGDNVAFRVGAAGEPVTFTLDTTTTPIVLVVGDAQADPDPEPEPDPEWPAYGAVSVPGSFNDELGCAEAWQPACDRVQMTERADGIWELVVPDLRAGAYEYKIAIDRAWTENYGIQDGAFAGPGQNVAFTHAGGPIAFYFHPSTKALFSTAEHRVITVPGSFQSELGCSGDWMPNCLRSMLTDPDRDGTFTFVTDDIPAGSYEAKAAYDMDWAENYGADGAPGGANVGFSVGKDSDTIQFSFDSASKVLTIGGQTVGIGGQGQLAAHWLSQDVLALPTSVLGGRGLDELSFRLHAAPEGGIALADGAPVLPDDAEVFDLVAEATGLPQDLAARFPHLAGHVVLRLQDADRTTVEAALTGQLVVTATAQDALVVFTGVQIPGVVDGLFAEGAAERELGVTWDSRKRPSVALWAPTAKDVDLLVWRDARQLDRDPVRVPLERQADGSWTVVGDKKWRHGAYQFDVTVYVPSTGAVETNRVTDPYSFALTVNSTHSVFVDLADQRWMPGQWKNADQPVVRPVDQTIYELHVRDFSISDETVPEELRGTYAAFTTEGAGRQHLRALQEAGLTTVHLLPTFDIATIEEDRSAQAEPPCDLASFAPDSAEQQACINEIRDADGFNWGYDPYHFSTPEGSYAVDAHGGARVEEFRSMVGALHADGLQVVLDKVFNHTAASGQDARSVLDRVVPGYYHRLNAAGSVETSTCCQNIATEHEMAEKLMVDSVVTWARDYKVDGFRFDLMGHHSTDNMLAVREALDALTPEKDGVDGSAVYLYGEGWNFGEVVNDTRFEQARQGNLGGTGIGTFTDRLRDAVRGGGPFDTDPRVRQGFGTGAYTDRNGLDTRSDADLLADAQHQADLVRLGLAGNLRDYSFLTSSGQVQRGDQIDYNGQPAGYADSPEEIITYVDKHDNETIFDVLALKLPQDTPMADRVRMNTVSLATAALSQTPAFFHAGSDLLRSKSLDRNSYNSGDWFNLLDFSGQDNGFARGLPQAGDNRDKWPTLAPLLADPALKPAPEHISTAAQSYQDLLELRFSTELFRLGDAGLIEQKVTFPGSGPSATPGVIVMSIDDLVGTDVDAALEGVLVVFNASDEAYSAAVPGHAGRDFALSSIQAEGTDDVVRGTTWDAGTGTVSVPARTVAVLVDPQAAAAPVAQAPVAQAPVATAPAGPALSGKRSALLPR